MKIQIIIFLLLVILILSICLIIVTSIASINILKYGGGIRELEEEITKQRNIYKTEIDHLTEYIKYILNIQILDENIKQQLIKDIYNKLGVSIPIEKTSSAINLSNGTTMGVSNDRIINSIKESIRNSIKDTIEDNNQADTIIKELQLKKIL